MLTLLSCDCQGTFHSMSVLVAVLVCRASVTLESEWVACV